VLFIRTCTCGPTPMPRLSLGSCVHQRFLRPTPISGGKQLLLVLGTVYQEVNFEILSSSFQKIVIICGCLLIMQFCPLRGFGMVNCLVFFFSN
jgi:hypothetical protein